MVRAAPDGDDWLHEIKLDGYRLIARLEAGAVRLQSRNGKDWTDRFPDLAERLARLPVECALLDGEAVHYGEGGISRFGRLQEALSAGRTEGVVYQAFDLLYLDHRDLRRTPLVARKKALAALLAAADLGPGVGYSDHQRGQSPDFYTQACRAGLEGIVSKRGDSGYRSGRSKQWLKVTAATTMSSWWAGLPTPAAAGAGSARCCWGPTTKTRAYAIAGGWAPALAIANSATCTQP